MPGRSENLRRRHLDAGQRAFLALEVEKHYAEIAKRRQAEAARQTTIAREAAATKSQVRPLTVSADRHQPSPYERKAATRAAETVGSSGRSVARAKYIQEHAPDLADKVKAGSLAIDNAERQARARVAEQRKHEPEPEKPKPHRAEPIMLTLRTHTGDVACN